MTIAARVAIALSLPIAIMAQDPYVVAGDHYHLVFENQWVRASRVTYGPHQNSPIHDHPETPTTVFIYVTDGGVMRIRHFTGDRVAGVTIDRKPVQAGAIRFAKGEPETHSVEYLGDIPTEYVTLELRTEPLDRPATDVRLPPVTMDPSRSATEVQFENGQIRIVRLVCASGQRCPDSEHPKDPAVVVVMSGPHRGEVDWSPERPAEGPMQQVRIELKSKPVNHAR
jgi:quercetin dioxygenase-like cupin family protein